jgi:MoaA/NifB/PqqE/SkfB family radical SAM enzyme
MSNTELQTRELRTDHAEPPDQAVPVPIHATWYCTDRCTLRCCHCFVPVVPASARPRELGTEEGKRLIDSLHDAEIFLIAFAGGEPLLRDDFFELSAYARARGLTLQTSTNGLTVDDDCVAQLQDVGYQCLQISLDGLTEETNAWTRGKGNFARTLAAIRACRRRQLPVVLAFAIHQRNLHEAAQLADFAEREGIEVLKAQPVYLPFGYDGGGASGTLSVQQLAELSELLDARFEGSSVRLKNVARRDKAEAQHSKICCRSFVSPTIFPDGSLSPCFNGRTIAVGNLARDAFVPTWQSAVRVVTTSGRCGCNRSHIDVPLNELGRGARAPGVV